MKKIIIIVFVFVFVIIIIIIITIIIIIIIIIIIKLLLFVYKSLNNHALEYLSDCFKIYVPGKRTRSSEDPFKLTLFN